MRAAPLAPTAAPAFAGADPAGTPVTGTARSLTAAPASAGADPAVVAPILTDPAVAAAILAAAILAAAGPAVASMPLETVASYQSTPLAHIATGGAFADLDGDGWLDMVVANGNDISRQHLSVYHNLGNGTFPATPTWESSDFDYNGHLDLGDVDGDGAIDAVVSVYIGAGGFSQPGHVKLYRGNGAGAFGANPDWVSDSFYTFSCALGDADGDGDLDLACAAGEDYENSPERQKVFYNVAGAFDQVPPWESADTAYALDVSWDDVDLDGDLDVVFCGTSSPLRVYENGQTEGSGLSTTATWQNADLPEYGNTAAFGDWNGDGYPELAVADNFQLGGQGKFKVYANTTGALATTPAWTSATGGYGSHVSWIDLDTDGDLDLAAGGWWDFARIFENQSGTLSPSPVWQSSRTSVIENMFWGDVDNDGLADNGRARAEGDGARTFYSTGQAPVHSIDAIRVGGVLLGAGDYCSHLANGWVSLATPPAPGEEVWIEFTYSADLDLGITTWDSSVGNFVHYNLRTPAGLPEAEVAVADLGATPNPVRRATRIRYRGPTLTEASLTVFDAAGRRVQALHEGTLAAGLQTWEWDRRDDGGRRVPNGIYFARLEAKEGSQSLRLVLVD